MLTAFIPQCIASDEIARVNQKIGRFTSVRDFISFLRMKNDRSDLDNRDLLIATLIFESALYDATHVDELAFRTHSVALAHQSGIIVPLTLIPSLLNSGFNEVGSVRDYRSIIKEIRMKLMQSGSFKYWVGAEVESVMHYHESMVAYDIQALACDFMHLTNYLQSLPGPTIPSLIDEALNFKLGSMVRADGQQKLWAIEFPFFALCDAVIMIGGSPGTRYRDHMPFNFPNDRVVVIDPREVEFECVHFDELYSEETFLSAIAHLGDFNSLFVSVDIRSDAPRVMEYGATLRMSKRQAVYLHSKKVPIRRVDGYSFQVQNVEPNGELLTIKSINDSTTCYSYYNQVESISMPTWRFIERIAYGKDPVDWNNQIISDWDITRNIVKDVMSLSSSHIVFILVKIRAVENMEFELPFAGYLLVEPYLKKGSSEGRILVSNWNGFCSNLGRRTTVFRSGDIRTANTRIEKWRTSGYEVDYALAGFWSLLAVRSENYAPELSAFLFSISNASNDRRTLMDVISSGGLVTTPYVPLWKKSEIVNTDVNGRIYSDHGMSLLDEVLLKVPMAPLSYYCSSEGIISAYSNMTLSNVVWNVKITGLQESTHLSTQLVKMLSTAFKATFKNADRFYSIRTEILMRKKDEYKNIMQARFGVTSSIEIIGTSGDFVFMGKRMSVSGHLLYILLGAVIGIPYGVMRYIYEKRRNLQGCRGYERCENKIWHTLLEDLFALECVIPLIREFYPSVTMQLFLDLQIIVNSIRHELLILASEYSEYIGVAGASPICEQSKSGPRLLFDIDDDYHDISSGEVLIYVPDWVTGIRILPAAYGLLSNYSDYNSSILITKIRPQFTEERTVMTLNIGDLPFIKSGSEFFINVDDLSVALLDFFREISHLTRLYIALQFSAEE